MNMKRRGLSDVVTTVLIILLVLAAVALIWGYLSTTLKDAGGQITSACLTLDVQPVSCVWNSTFQTALVRYQRNAGDGNLQAVSLVLTVDGNNLVRNATRVPATLESFSQNITGIASQPTAFAVAGTILTESGSDKMCPQSEPVTCSAGKLG